MNTTLRINGQDFGAYSTKTSFLDALISNSADKVESKATRWERKISELSTALQSQVDKLTTINSTIDERRKSMHSESTTHISDIVYPNRGAGRNQGD